MNGVRLSGFDLETFLKMTNTSIDDYRAQYRIGHTIELRPN